MKNKTVGQAAYEALLKQPDTRDPVELQQEMQKDYIANLEECTQRGKNQLPYQDFFLVVETKKERLLTNVIRNYFFFRMSCPTPTYDNTVYHYHQKGDYLELLWVVPSKDTCQLLRAHALEVVPAERELLDYVIAFYDGTLLQLAKKLNGEKKYNIALEE